MQVLRYPFTFRASDGEPISCDIRLPFAGKKFPVLVIAHGFKGFKNWGFFPWLGQAMAARGWYVVQFNFSHNGVEGDSEEFTRLDKFASNTFSREVRELREVITMIEQEETPDAGRADFQRLATLGHSRGGGIALVEGSTDERVKAIATWASVSSFNRYTIDQKERWREEGYLEATNARTGQLMRLDLSLLEDLEEHQEELDVMRAAETLARPLLLVHGEVDLAVTISNAERLAEVADPELTTFVRIPKAGHTIGAVHPFEGTNQQLEQAIEETDTFLREAVGADQQV